MTDIYCYYHRHARLEITQRHGQTYAVCPECRQILAASIRNEISRAQCGDHRGSDDMLHRLITAPTYTPPPIKHIRWPIIVPDTQP